MKKFFYVLLLSLVAQVSCAEHHEMGQALGTWQFEHVSNVYSKDSNGQIILQTNWRGSAANYGVVFGTLTLGPNSMDTFKAQIPSRAHWIGQGFLPDGTVAIGDGYGILATKKSVERPSLPPGKPLLMAGSIFLLMPFHNRSSPERIL